MYHELVWENCVQHLKSIFDEYYNGFLSDNSPSLLKNSPFEEEKIPFLTNQIFHSKLE
jgi:hypothetical protein